MCRMGVEQSGSRSGLHLSWPRRRPAGLPRRVPSSAFLRVLCGYYRSFSNISRTTYLRRTDELQRAQRAQRRNSDHRACTSPRAIAHVKARGRAGRGVSEWITSSWPATTTCRLTSPSSVLCVPLRPLRLLSFLLQNQPDDVPTRSNEPDEGAAGRAPDPDVFASGSKCAQDDERGAGADAPTPIPVQISEARRNVTYIHPPLRVSPHDPLPRSSTPVPDSEPSSHMIRTISIRLRLTGTASTRT